MVSSRFIHCGWIPRQSQYAISNDLHGACKASEIIYGQALVESKQFAVATEILKQSIDTALQFNGPVVVESGENLIRLANQLLVTHTNEAMQICDMASAILDNYTPTTGMQQSVGLVLELIRLKQQEIKSVIR
jgi:hypothetical protein